MTGRYSINGHWNAAQGLRAPCHLCHLRQATGPTHQCTWKMHDGRGSDKHTQPLYESRRMFRPHSSCRMNLLPLREFVNACRDGHYAVFASWCRDALLLLLLSCFNLRQGRYVFHSSPFVGWFVSRITQQTQNKFRQKGRYGWFKG